MEGSATETRDVGGGPRPEPEGSSGRRRGPASRGLLFDEFRVNDRFVSQARTVTEADVVTFAGLSGDYNPLHTDEEYARGTAFRGRIAHGLLVQAIASGLANQTAVFDGTIVAIKEMQIGFLAPVHPGDTVHIELCVLELDPEPGAKRGWVRFSADVLNQRGERVIGGEWLTVMHRRRVERRSAGRREG